MIPSAREAKVARKEPCANCGALKSYDSENDLCQPCQMEAEYGKRNGRILEAWEAGVPAKEIARREGMNHQAVLAWIDFHRRRKGEPISRRQRKDRELWPAIEGLYHEGLTYQGMAGALGIIAATNLPLGPLWYPVALEVSALPTSWLGGTLYVRRSRS